jgi:hypothetical protein
MSSLRQLISRKVNPAKKRGVGRLSKTGGLGSAPAQEDSPSRGRKRLRAVTLTPDRRQIGVVYPDAVCACTPAPAPAACARFFTMSLSSSPTFGMGLTRSPSFASAMGSLLETVGAISSDAPMRSRIRRAARDAMKSEERGCGSLGCAQRICPPSAAVARPHAPAAGLRGNPHFPVEIVRVRLYI